ncbi:MULTISPECIES: peroxiredoxin [Hydrogenophilus]|mgnify:CR=1 FL=1|jgi:peroxiredoxin Q/BCP|uniref:thioredoxin-dependent peroxiredoxin n=1 Tax=Hydrogenophilus thermoluteolus TaxID=297 RepID=A0A2Z6DYA9_HYDTE|nr:MULTISPECIES: peroxiredoxin [Hydrogenophilus]HCO77427.1 peroxiredoxin [Rhodocyclaceae bacterium]BBD77501.1 peroxiredoxin [Hydrogenophilus thermoluteolus]GLW59735.1 peroxiredoxin [Hydrogenophilus thermoluteolus]HNQ47876.1 peroxiredoxin [Hydrogenophilus thermoluteolus]HNU20520.1 peroxiredoxin [Hydrogenophilus thermoluteolus]
MTLELNQPAPDFTLPATGNQTITLSALKGKPVVLYFYPRDNTPGCTNEAIAFRDLYDQFTALGAVILGLSRDSVASHEKFKAKFSLPFDLVSDPEEVACQAYDVMRNKTMYGKPVRGIERSTFLIDADGNIAAIWRKVKVDGHAEAVLAKLREIAKNA